MRYRQALLAIVYAVLIVFAGLFLHGCAINPVSGRQEFMLLSESDEIRLGKATDSEIARTYGLYHDEALQTYLETLGQQLARKSHRSGLSFRLETPRSKPFLYNRGESPP